MPQHQFTLGPALVVILFLSTPSIAKQADTEEQKAIAATDRFQSILEKNPQRGTALEKVFVHHLQRGTLDAFVQSQQQRTETNPDDGNAWMLIGLIESQRRQDTTAIAAFAKAEKLRPQDALPAYYRGQCLLRTGEPTRAVEAFELAIQRQPSRFVLLELFELIGRTHQRQNRNDLAIDCWKRLEAMFPDDLRVLEQIASTQNQEGAYGDALPRYEKLIALSKEAYQRTQFRIEVTQLQIKMGEPEKGLTGLESILAELKPEGWLYRDVQRKIEEVFIKANDPSGLIQFYEKRLAQFPDEIESMIRLSKFLTASARVAEANQWMTQAIQRAPSRLELRRTFIEQLIADHQFTAAIEQYSRLAQLDPTNLDILREWGKLVLRDPSHSIDETKNEAARIWSKMLESRTDEALVHIQVADLYVSAQMPNEAEKLFERAISLAPDEAQYREFFGDFLFQQDRPEQAFAAWNAIAEGERRNAATVMRLADIYSQAKQYDTASKLAIEACSLAPKDPMLRIRTAKMQSKANRFDEALESLTQAEKIAENDDQRESILADRISTLEKSNRLKQEADSLQRQLSTLQTPDASSLAQRQLLARYLVRLRRWPEAQIAITEALRSDENNLTMLLAAAETADGLGDAPRAIDSLRKLAAIDRRKRQEYLQRIAQLQLKQGQIAEAVETAKEVVQAVPSKIEGYEFMAQVCFQSNKRDLGIETLRRALRMDSSSNRLTIALGNALSDNKNFGEAIELYWQLLLKSNKLDDKIDLTVSLVKLHQLQSPTASRNGGPETIEPLIDRLESMRRDPSQRHDLTLCLAQVYQSVADFVNAKQTLEELLSDRVRDSNVLKRLAEVCEAGGDLETAIDYQRQLVAMTPGQESESRLANLLRLQGDWSGANAIVMKLLQSERDPVAALKNIDSLLQRGELELILRTIEPMIRKEPDNWELLFRKGLALAGTDQWDESQAVMERILELDAPRTDSNFKRDGTVASDKNRASKSLPTSGVAETRKEISISQELETIQRDELLEIATGRGKFAVSVSNGGMGAGWSPQTYGEVRWAAIAWLVCGDSKQLQHKSAWIAYSLRSLSGTSSRLAWLDALAVAKFRQDSDAQISAIGSLMVSGEPGLNRSFLEIVRRRQVSGIPSENKRQRPLTPDQIPLLLGAYESVQNEPLASQGPSPSVSSGARVNSGVLGQYTNQGWYSGWSPLQMKMPMLEREGFERTVVNELRFAGQSEQSEAFLSSQVESAKSERQIANLCEYFLNAGRYSDVEKPLSRWFAIQLEQAMEKPAPATVSTSSAWTTAIVNSDATPTDFACRLIEKQGDAASLESIARYIDLAAAISEQKFLNRDFASQNASGLLSNAIQARNQMRALQLPQIDESFVVHKWATHLLSADLQRLIGSAARSRDLTGILRSRVDRVDESVRPLAKLLSSLHFPAVSFPAVKLPIEADRRIIEALREIGKQPGCSLVAAAALLDRENFAEARSIAETVIPSGPQESLSRELIILLSSAALKDKAKMKVALLSLASQKLDVSTLQSLAYVLQYADAVQLANEVGLFGSRNGVRNTSQARKVPGAMPSRAAPPRTAPPRTAPTKPASSKEETLHKEMLEFTKEGKKAEAIKAARMIVSKPRVFPAAAIANGPRSANQALQPRKPSPSASTESLVKRESAFLILVQHNELEKLIAEAEQRLKSAPNSFLLLEQLAEYYEHFESKGNQVNATRLLVQALEVRPNASSLRLHFANLLFDSKKTNEACDQFLELIRRDANLGLMSIRQSQAAFAASGRTDELLKAIRDANFQSIRDRTAVNSEAAKILNFANEFEVGAAMLEKLAVLDPKTLQQAVFSAYSGKQMVYPRLFRFTSDALIPTENDVMESPWFGLEDPRFIVGSSFAFNGVLTAHRVEDLAEELKPIIQSAVDRFPGWYAGPVMLAMIAERTKSSNDYATRLAELAMNKRLIAACPPDIACSLALQFSEHPEYRAVTIQLMEPLIGNRQYQSPRSNTQHRPALILAKAWLADGNRAKALEALLMDAQVENQSSLPQTGFPGMNRPTLAKEMLSLGLPVEAYRLLDLKKSGGTPASGPRELQDAEAMAKAMEAGRSAALAMLAKMPPEKAVAELLMDRSIASTQLSSLELMLQAPLVKEARYQTKSMESVLQSTLIRHAKTGQLQAIKEGLQKFANSYPSDVNVLATKARVELEMQDADATVTLNALEQVLSKFDPQIDQLIANVADDGSKAPVPDFAESVVATWLVAKQCYIAGKHLDAAERIASRAFEVAKLMDTETIRSRLSVAKNNPVIDLGPEAELASIILFEWGKTEIRTGRFLQGRERWDRLMRHVSIDNAAGAIGVLPVESKSPIEISWQQNQFEWLLNIAHIALNEDQLELSKSTALRIAKRRLPLKSPYVTGNRIATESEAKPAAYAAQELMDRWPQDASTALERYTILLSMILPGERDVHLFMERSRILEEKPRSLATHLIESASQSSKIVELKEMLDVREPISLDKLRWLVLRIQVAIAAKDFGGAKEFLKRLNALILGEKQVSGLATACHAAIPAFQVDELREEALPILNAYIAREKASGNYPDVDFSLFPLVLKVESFLKNRR